MTRPDHEDCSIPIAPTSFCQLQTLLHIIITTILLNNLAHTLFAQSSHKWKSYRTTEYSNMQRDTAAKPLHPMIISSRHEVDALIQTWVNTLLEKHLRLRQVLHAFANMIQNVKEKGPQPYTQDLQQRLHHVEKRIRSVGPHLHHEHPGIFQELFNGVTNEIVEALKLCQHRGDFEKTLDLIAQQMEHAREYLAHADYRDFRQNLHNAANQFEQAITKEADAGREILPRHRRFQKLIRDITSYEEKGGSKAEKLGNYEDMLVKIHHTTQPGRQDLVEGQKPHR